MSQFSSGPSKPPQATTAVGWTSEKGSKARWRSSLRRQRRGYLHLKAPLSSLAAFSLPIQRPEPCFLTHSMCTWAENAEPAGRSLTCVAATAEKKYRKWI